MHQSRPPQAVARRQPSLRLARLVDIGSRPAPARRSPARASARTARPASLPRRAAAADRHCRGAAGARPPRRAGPARRAAAPAPLPRRRRCPRRRRPAPPRRPAAPRRRSPPPAAPSAAPPHCPDRPRAPAHRSCAATRPPAERPPTRDAKRAGRHPARPSSPSARTISCHSPSKSRPRRAGLIPSNRKHRFGPALDPSLSRGRPVVACFLTMISLNRACHCEERSDEAIQRALDAPLDCFASLAMTRAAQPETIAV
jgi:hypothetical protein